MPESQETKGSHRIQITIAVIGAAAVILAALIGIIPSILRDREAAPAPPTSPALATGAPTSSGGARNGVALPPGYAGNIRSVKANYGCGILFASKNDDPLQVCDPLPSLPTEWITRIQRVDADCATSASDRIILELWTGDNFDGEYWAYTFGC
jgi:hypothetical protein